jgi:hypothetical protein
MSNVKAKNLNEIQSDAGASLFIVTPVKAGVQTSSLWKQGTIKSWIPGFTGNPGFLLPQE